MSARTLIPRFGTSGPGAIGGNSRAVLPVLAADAEHLGDARDRLALLVEDGGLELGVDLARRVGLLLQPGEQRGRHLEPGADASAAWPEEFDGGALVPDDIVVAERHHDHEHEERIAHRVERAAKLRPHEVA